MTNTSITSDNNSEIMTLSEIARYLKVSEKTVMRMVRAGKIPGAKVASQWRFMRAAVDDWLNARMYALPRTGLYKVINTADRVVPISELVSPQRIVLDLKPGEIEPVLAQLIVPLRGSDLVPDPDEFLSQLVAREEMISTAIGHGLAVPHARSPESIEVPAPFLIIGICRRGTDFNALDGRKTYVFALPCTNRESEHLHMMAKISLLFRKQGIIKQMRTAESVAEIMTIIKETDREIEYACEESRQKILNKDKE